MRRMGGDFAAASPRDPHNAFLSALNALKCQVELVWVLDGGEFGLEWSSSDVSLVLSQVMGRRKVARRGGEVLVVEAGDGERDYQEEEER